MNKLAIFDMDGVLCSLKDMHFRALNDALIQHGDFPISREDHLTRFDGLPTKKKLQMLGYSLQDAQDIQALKQKLTLALLPEYVKPDPELAILLHSVYESGFLLAVASNACQETVDACLKLLSVDCQFSWAVSPSANLRPKPSPDMYLWIMKAADACPATTIIFEDAPAGLKAAHASGAKVVQVNGELDHLEVLEAIAQERLAYRYQWPELEVLMPMAGEGSRFRESGYHCGKPSIDVEGKSMAQAAFDSLGIDTMPTCLIRNRMAMVWAFQIMLDKPTRGTTETCLKAKQLLDDDPLLIANCDQILEWDHVAFYYFAQNTALDAIIVTFGCPEPDNKWSYCEVGNDGLVKRVAEKDPISAIGCTGVWFWKHGSDFVKYAEELIAKDIRVNGEYYLSLCYNLAIADGKKVGTFRVEKFHSLGTPELLDTYLKRNAK